MAVLTLTQYLDTMKGIGQSDNAKVMFLDSNLGTTSKLMQTLMSAIESGKK
jgi:hypothetical protein